MNMKLIWKILICILCLFVDSNIYSQDNDSRHSYNFSNTDIKSALEEITKDYELMLIFSNSKVNLDQKINKQYDNNTLKEILDDLFDNTSITYHIKGNQLILVQKKKIAFFSISGTVTDKLSGESLIGANVYNPDNYQGIISNNYGFYSLNMSSEKVKLVCSYVGYHPYTLEFYNIKDTVINIELSPNLSSIQEVVVMDKSPQQTVQSSQMSSIDLNVTDIKSAPVLLGESDVLKTLQTMPGVQGGTEGSSGFFVRGGSPDQNLILLDGVPVYNVNHLFGFFSVFNTDVIKNVNLVKGGFPARYGGRLSSVVDIRMKEGNKKEWKGEGSVGILSSKITVEGPIKKDNSSIIISGRRTYYDIFTYPVQFIYNKSNRDDFNVGAFFYDLNMKYNKLLKNNDRIYLSAYLGKDKFYIKENYYYNYSLSKEETEVNSNYLYGFKWGNITTALRWNHIFNEKIFSNLTATFSDYTFGSNHKNSTTTYRMDTVNNSMHYESDYYSRIRDYGVKYDFDWPVNNKNYIRFGASYTLHAFSPGVHVMKEDYSTENWSFDSTSGEKNIKSNEVHAYIEDDITLTSRLKANIGGHFSMFIVDGKIYYSPEPRISARYLITDRLSFKAGYTGMTQYINLLTNSVVGLPTDLWAPSTKLLLPQKSWQIATCIAYNLNNKYEITLESYYKEMKNLVEFAEGSGLYSLSLSELDEIASQGNGTSYGMEFMIQKSSGKLRGHLSYTWSRSDRTFEEISFGRTFPFSYDRRHTISAIATYDINNRINLSGGWVYYTGRAFTIMDEKYFSTHSIEYDFYGGSLETNNNPESPEDDKYSETRNNYRMPAYHRLDAGINFKKQKKRALRTWSFGVYNAYFHQNSFMIFEKESSLKQISIFPFVPYLRYGLKF